MMHGEQCIVAFADRQACRCFTFEVASIQMNHGQYGRPRRKKKFQLILIMSARLHRLL